MTTTTVITHPSEEVKKLLETIKERKEHQLDRLNGRTHGIFSIKV